MLSLSSIATIIGSLTVGTLALTAYYTRHTPQEDRPDR
jgi:hypothetical protein